MSRKLILFAYDFPPLDGGVARLCGEISKGMTHYFEEVMVLTPQNVSQQILDHGVKVKQLPSKRILCEMEVVKFFSRLKNKDDYTVLCALWHPEAILALLSGIKRVFVLGHGAEFLYGNSPLKKQLWLNFYASYILKRIKGAVANSHFTSKLVENISKKAHVQTLPLGVNPKVFKPINPQENKPFTIVTVARLHPVKGHLFVLQALNGLPEKIKKNLKWRIAGTGAFKSKIEAKIKEFGFQNQVELVGFVPDEGLPAFYNTADVFVLCSQFSKDIAQVEGFGLVFLEAQSCGVPVIGTRTGGIPDAVEHGNSGWLVSSNDVEELQKKIIQLYSDRQLLNKHRTKARERVLAKATWDIYNQKLAKIIT